MDEKEREIMNLKKKIVDLDKRINILNNEIESILDLIPGFLFSKDKNDYFTRVNKTFAKHLGLPKDNIIGKKTSELFPIAQADDFRKDDLEILKNRIPKFNIETYTDFANEKMWLLTNKIPHFNENGDVQGIIGLSFDITKRKEIEEKLKESEEKYKILFEQAPDSIYLVDPNTQELIEFNHKAYENLGYTKEEFKYLKVSDIEYNDTPEEIIERMQTLIRIGGDHEFETVHETKNGDLRNIYVSIKVITVLGKKYCQIICKDVTHLKKFEDKLKKSELKFREAFYTANFYKDVLTHDISNILQSIVSYIDFYNIYKKNKKVKNHIGNIYDIIKYHAHRIAALISNIRILSTLQEDYIQLHEIVLHDVLNQAIENIKKRFSNKNVIIDVKECSMELKIVANELLITIFENVISNAIIHNDNSDKIEIQIKISKQKLSNINYVNMEFIDNGRGILDERKERLFNRRYDEDPSKRGMGLGLTLVYKIIEKYGGKIWIEDRIKGDYRKGSNVILQFRKDIKMINQKC